VGVQVTTPGGPPRRFEHEPAVRQIVTSPHSQQVIEAGEPISRQEYVILKALEDARQSRGEVQEARLLAALRAERRRVVPAARRPLPRDPDGHQLCPDPMKATTAAELMDVLRQYHVWSGRPSLRRIAARSERQTSASTICAVLKSSTLPSLRVLLAIVAGCGGSDEDAGRFAAAWRAIELGIPLAAVQGADTSPTRPLRSVG
jgi:hypothetical protein